MPQASPPGESASFADRVRSAVLWRSGSQILAQAVSWGSTLLVIRLLHPADYGLFAMTGTVLAILAFLNGHAFASSLIREPDVDARRVRQVFGLLLLLNLALAAIQFAAAPLVAAYYRQPLVGDMLRWQALIFLATPFLAVPEALAARRLDFRPPAYATLAGTLAGAATALGCALAGLGVWALVAAPVALFWTRAAILCLATRFVPLPSFDFRGIGATLGFGSVLVLSQGFWVFQTQADVIIGGRTLDPWQLGLYTEALFLTQIFATKFVPPLNEVAYPAYAEAHRSGESVAWLFLKTVRIVLFAACPVFFGLGIAAGEAVETLFGRKWLGMIPLVQVLAFAMPLVTLQILFAPALNAIGRPGITARNSLAGAILLGTSFLIGSRWGTMGLAWAWVGGYLCLLVFSVQQSRRAIGYGMKGLAAAIGGPVALALAMVVAVAGVGALLPETLPAPLRLLLLAASGATAYGLLAMALARPLIDEAAGLLLKRRRASVRPAH